MTTAQLVIVILLIIVLILEMVRLSMRRVLASDNLILETVVRVLATASKLGGNAYISFNSEGVNITYMPEDEDESVGQYDEGAQV